MSGRKFLWGVSTSGYQSEGGFNGPLQPRNNWALSEESGRVMRTGLAVDFWNRFDEDFDRTCSMGCNAFRLGIEWARIQPSAAEGRLDRPPEFDSAAIDAYADRIAAARSRNLEPMVTLQHFTHPEWIGLDAWLEDRVVDLFGEYVERVVRQINRRLVDFHQVEPIRWIVTLNEPNMLIQNTYIAPHFPGVRRGLKAAMEALNRLLAAHIRAYNIIHDIYEEERLGEVQVTTNTFCSDVYWSEQVIYDVLTVREREAAGGASPSLEDVFAENSRNLRRAVAESKLPFPGGIFVALGRGLARFVDWLAPRYFTTRNFDFVLTELRASKRVRVFDFIGLDYYDPFGGHLFRPPTFSDLEFQSKGLHAWLMDGITSKWWDWRALPEGLNFFCHHYTALYGRELIIAENGMAHRRRTDNSDARKRRDEITRSEFLRQHVSEVLRMKQNGCGVRGYFHWSLTDNYEWGSFTPRFGLFSIDYSSNLDRHVEDHLGDRPSETYAELIRSAEAAESGGVEGSSRS